MNKPVSACSRRAFIKKNVWNCTGLAIGMTLPVCVSHGASNTGAPTIFDAIQPPAAVGAVNSSVDIHADGLKIAVFDVDATPPVGSLLAYDQMATAWDLGLRAKGLVLTGAGDPIVLCAIDWIGIANESQDAFKQTLANAVRTVPERVVVHSLHQHDAPICDFGAEKMLKAMGIAPESFDGAFARELLGRLEKAAKESLDQQRPLTDISLGKAPVFEVASNRRIVKDGKAGPLRSTACKDPDLRNEPEGLIDPDVTLIGFWDGEQPVAVMTFYATHPQSYYLTKIANPDFPGVARFYRQLSMPEALHIHFTGAGGNIGAGKYNDGSPINRLILAGRLADGMERAWKNSVKRPVTAGEIAWKTVPVALPVAHEKVRDVEKQIKTAPMRFRTNNMSMIVWAKRVLSGKTIDIACLNIGQAKVLFMPGELFVEYQLAAKALRPDLAVSMAAYGDFGPFYIGTKKAYSEGGYEIESSPLTPEVEEVLMKAIHQLMD